MNKLDQIAESYQERIKELADAYEAQMQSMQASLERLGREADIKIQTALSERSSSVEADEEQSLVVEDKTKLNPSAAWIVAEDGEHLLVLNQAAAAMQVALLDQLVTVLDELTKTVVKK